MHSVVYAELMHETNSFSLRRTGEAEFTAGHLHAHDAALAAFEGTRSSPGAAIEAARTHGWRLRMPLTAEATPSGLVTQAFFERCAGRICEAVRVRPLDGVLLHLHGSMATETSDDGDGELLRRIREAVGPSVPIVAVLDLHATVTQAMADAVQALVAYRTYPHVDMHERTLQAAALLDDAMAGRIRPRVTLARPPLLYGCDGGRTSYPDSPMNRLLAEADAVERRGDALVVSIQAGFSSIDSPAIGPSVAVTTDDDEAAGRALCERFSALIWETRDIVSNVFTPIADAVAEARAGESAARPLVIADFADNPGAGAYGDATALLRAMIDAGLRRAILHAIFDPQAVRAAAEAGVGARLTLDVGGRTAPGMGGGPLRLEGVVERITDGRYVADGPMGGGVTRNDGTTALFRVGGIAIVLTSTNQQATDLAQITSLGLDPLAAATIAVKSMQHFRAAFGPIARRIVEIDSGALCTRDFLRRPYRKVRRPLYPLDPIEACEHDLPRP